ncbi:MAG: hypothetical protein ACYC1U_10760 [Candidatus Aquicultorales bacterium]
MRPGPKQAAVILIVMALAALAVGWISQTTLKKPVVDTGEVSPPRAEAGSGAGRDTGAREQSGQDFRISCNEPCHSGRPPIVRMHDATRDRSCMECHSPDENLMSGGASSSSAGELAERQTVDAKCAGCHKPGGLAEKAASGQAEIKPVKQVGGFFCPKCQATVDVETGRCGECGGSIERSGDGWRCTVCGPLVDVDRVAKLSKEKPSNDICLLCHQKDASLQRTHSTVASGEKWASQIQDCLSCHKSHNNCGGCHFGPKS